MKNILIDIGTHKSEELNVLFNPGFSELKLLFKETVKYLLKRSRLSWKVIAKCWGMLLSSNKRSNKENIKIFALEPNLAVSRKNIKRLEKVISIVHFPIVILGHDHANNFDLVTLNIFRDSLSSSLYEKNNLEKLEKIHCLGLDFYYFIELLCSKGVLDKENRIIVRMNCEGAELGVVSGVDRLLQEGYKVVSILGSLADVQKIHGDEAYKKMLEILQNNNLKYVYFKGTDLNTWEDGVAEINKVFCL